MVEHLLSESVKPASCVHKPKDAFMSCLMRLQQVVPGVTPEEIGPQYSGLQFCQAASKAEAAPRRSTCTKRYIISKLQIALSGFRV